MQVKQVNCMFAHYLSSTPRALGSRQAADCQVRHTGVPPLRGSHEAAQCSDAFKARCITLSDCHRRYRMAFRYLQQDGSLPSRSERSRRSWLRWLALSRIGKGIPDEWVFTFQAPDWEGVFNPFTNPDLGGQNITIFRGVFQKNLKFFSTRSENALITLWT